MPHRPLFILLPALLAVGASPVVVSAQAQIGTVVPSICADLPGNAAVAMPLRWSHGTMQVFVDAALLPPAFVGQTITGLHLRRATLLGDVAYPALTRTLTVRGGFLPFPAAQMVGSIAQNRPATTTVLFGPAPLTTNAVGGPGPTTITGAELLHVPFTTPLVVAAGTLFLELEAGDTPLQVSDAHWVDAVWFSGGNDLGLVAAVGDGSCTTRPEPVHLRWTSGGPAAGTSRTFEVSGAPPTSGASAGFVFAWAGIDPSTRGPGPGYLGYGASLGALDPGMAACHQWAPLDVSWFGATGITGTFSATLTIPAAAAVGLRLGLQAAWLDLSRPVLPLSLSNGLHVVVGSAGVGNHCNTMYFPAGTTTSPWAPFVGQMPVLRLEH
jgi:hypothetical protein